MHPIGYSDLAGHGGAFKMAIKHVNDHWYLYMGHLWNSGWSIVDVTDPTNPKVVKFIPWSNSNTMTGQMEIHGNIMLTSLRTPGARLGEEKIGRGHTMKACSSVTSAIP